MNSEMSSAQIIGIQSDWIKKLERELSECKELCAQKDKLIAQKDAQIERLTEIIGQMKADKQAEAITTKGGGGCARFRNVIILS